MWNKVTTRAAWTVFCCVCGLTLSAGQLSSPISSNDHVSVDGNRFLTRTVDKTKPQPSSEGLFNDGSVNSCPQNVQLKWMAVATSSIYGTPVITDLFADGFKDIIVPSFVHYLEAFQADNGAQNTGFPAYHASKVHASPLMFDMDQDGIQDILLATYDGEITFYKDTGEPVEITAVGTKLKIPPLSVKRDWYITQVEDNADHAVVTEHEQVAELQHMSEEEAAKLAAEHAASLKAAQAQAKELHEAVQKSHAKKREEQAPSIVPAEARRRLLADMDGAAGGVVSDRPLSDIPQVEDDPKGKVSEEAADSFHSLEDEYVDGGLEANEAEDDAASEFDAFLNKSGKKLGDQVEDTDAFDNSDDSWGFHDDYLALQNPGDEWEEDWARPIHGVEQDHQPFPQGVEDIRIDPHIMCSPSIGDIDGDGRDDLVIAVSYLFDSSYYDIPEHKGELPDGLDITMYLASGVVVFDLVLHTVKWTQHLDLTTTKVDYRAYAYSTPTLADLDHDGKMEVIVGTSVGYLYVLNYMGEPIQGWPVQMGEIQGQPAVADVNGDGLLEIFAADTRGSAAMFDTSGAILWDVHIGSAVAQNAVFGDVNGDGELEVVFGSANGQVHVLNAKTGISIPNFPYNTTGRIVSPVLITRLEDTPQQHLVVMSFDGFMYMIDGFSACADVVDIGESSYTSILADDLDNDGRMDLLVSTMNGHLYAFQTPAEYDPLKTWTSQVPGVSSFVARHGLVGIAGTPMTRKPKDIRGTTFPVQFEITDNVLTAAELASGTEDASVPKVEQKRLGAPYLVKILLQGIGTTAMNAGDQPIIGMSDTFNAPGIFTMDIPCPRSRATAIIRIELHDTNGIVYVDEFAQSFHIHFYRLLKWMIAGPLIAMSLFVLVLKPENNSILPS